MDQDLNITPTYEPVKTSTDTSGLDMSVPYFGDVYFIMRPVLCWHLFGIGFPGAVGNILTILVYIKLGLHVNTINMSYTALAFSDLFSVLSAQLNGISNTFVMDVVLNVFRIKADWSVIAALIGAWPHLVFSRITALMTAWISFQRCLCVLLPLRSRVIASPTVTKLAIAAIFIAGSCPIASVYLGLNSDWQFDPQRNQTVFFLSYDNSGLGFAISMLLYGLVYPVLSWVLVAVCTTCLVVRLRASARWRRYHSSASATVETNQRQVSANENRVNKCVVTVAGIFTVCSIPLSANALAVVVFPEYASDSKFQYLFEVNFLASMLLSEVNSSVNIIVFAVQGHKFRATLVRLLRGVFCISHYQN